MSGLMRLLFSIMLFVPLAAVAADQPAAPPATPTAGSSDGYEARAALPARVPVVRIGYVDIMKVAEQSDAGKVSKAHFEAKADRYKTRIDTKQKLLEKQKAALEAKLPTYTPEQRVAKIKDYQKKVDELRKMLQEADKEMKPMQEELTREVYSKIESAAREYGAAKGYAVVLEKKELLYVGANVEAEDVTEALIREMNKK